MRQEFVSPEFHYSFSFNQVVYDVPVDLQQAIGEFVEFYNPRRYHKALKDVTPSDTLEGRRDQILARRKEAKTRSFERRKEHNRIDCYPFVAPVEGLIFGLHLAATAPA